MKFLPFSSIIIPEKRQRTEFDEAAMQDLIGSIGDWGLLHALVVRNHTDGTVILVAGERRLRALKELSELGQPIRYGGETCPPDSAPIVSLGDLSPLYAREAELEENIRREDLTWQERVTAESELVALRIEKAAVGGLPPPTPMGIAAELRGKATPNTVSSVNQSLLLAKNLHRPEVAQAKSRTEAFKAMKRVEEKEKNTELAEKLGRDHLSGKHRLVNGDCVEWLQSYPDEWVKFSVVCSDPPYGMGADQFGDSGGKMGDGAHFYDDSYESWQKLMSQVLPQLDAVTALDAHLYLFCDLDRFHELKEAVETWTKFTVFRTPLIWFKPSAFRAPWPEKGPQRKYECILYAVRGDLKCTALAGDVILCPPDENLGHPAQKPVALIQNLLARSVRPGMHVLDPFCGSGPVFEAGHALSAIVTGVERDAASCGIAAGRLKKLGGGV